MEGKRVEIEELKAVAAASKEREEGVIAQAKERFAKLKSDLDGANAKVSVGERYFIFIRSKS